MGHPKTHTEVLGKHRRLVGSRHSTKSVQSLADYKANTVENSVVTLDKGINFKELFYKSP